MVIVIIDCGKIQWISCTPKIIYHILFEIQTLCYQQFNLISRQESMIQNVQSRGKNKATALKKLIQQACNSQKAQTSETSQPVSARIKSSAFETSKSKMTTKENSLNKDNLEKDLKSSTSLRKGFSSIAMKNKENICINKKASNGVEAKSVQSEVSKSKPLNTTTKSMKQIKITPICTSIELPKLLKTISTTMNKDRKGLKFQSSVDCIYPATARDRSKHSEKRDLLKKVGSGKQKNELKITDFNLGKKLGKGRFGSVRLAQDKTTKFVMAIKTINIAQLKESQMEAQLIEEIKLQMYCNHPNVLKMYGCFHDSKNIYLLLELGIACLFQQLRVEKHFQEQKTAYYGKQMVQSLKYLHSENIIHRDIKPQNILMSYGVLKLSDFGWSTYSPVLKRQTFCGTLDYVSPQIVNGEYYDQRVDIWSLGVLFYELAVGKAPFEDPNNNQQATYDKILAADISFPQRVSNELQDLISRILLPNPKNRLSMPQIETHQWFQRYKTAGRFISKQIWDLWDKLKGEEK